MKANNPPDPFDLTFADDSVWVIYSGHVTEVEIRSSDPDPQPRRLGVWWTLGGDALEWIGDEGAVWRSRKAALTALRQVADDEQVHDNEHDAYRILVERARSVIRLKAVVFPVGTRIVHERVPAGKSGTGFYSESLRGHTG